MTPSPRRLPWIFLLLLLGIAVGGFYLLNRPRLRFTNRLAAPVRLALGSEPRTVAPGETVTAVVPRGRTLVVEWEMVRPLSADGQPMGEPVRGSAVLRGPRGTLVDSAASRVAGTDYFAPLVTNATDHLLRVTVNAGLQGAVDCGCAIRPGARRAFIGYYRLYRNSTVRAAVAGGGRATFRDLGDEVTSADGTVGLRFEDKDFSGSGGA
ncbi:MAG: hypothetical protein ACREMX_17275 [Gemmatimonadales bacterium]